MSTMEITTQNFESVVDGNDVVLLDAWATWCGPCRAFEPIYSEAADRHPDVVWGKLDTEAQPEVAAAFEIRSIPTVMVFRQGILVFQQPGVLPGPALDELVEKVKALDMDEVRRELDSQSE